MRVLPEARTASGEASRAPITASGSGRPSNVYPYVVSLMPGDAPAMAFKNPMTSS